MIDRTVKENDYIIYADSHGVVDDNFTILGQVTEIEDTYIRVSDILLIEGMADLFDQNDESIEVYFDDIISLIKLSEYKGMEKSEVKEVFPIDNPEYFI